MDIEHELKELKKVFELADNQGISPIAALGIIDIHNAAKDKAEYEALIDDLYKDVLAKSYDGDSTLMARSLLGYICGLSVREKLSKLPKVKSPKNGRPATSWGAGGEGKLVIFAAVEHLKEKKKQDGVKLKIKDALWQITELDRSKRSDIKKIEALASAYSAARSKVINDKANKVLTKSKKL